MVQPNPLELLCEKAIATCNRPLGAGEALRRVMECLASGILLPASSTFQSSILQSRNNRSPALWSRLFTFDKPPNKSIPGIR
ncbi:spermatid perinuclear RNA-binding protein isoform X1, partial [Tachysurus ichikawai]